MRPWRCKITKIFAEPCASCSDSAPLMASATSFLIWGSMVFLRKHTLRLNRSFGCTARCVHPCWSEHMALLNVSHGKSRQHEVETVFVPVTPLEQTYISFEDDTSQTITGNQMGSRFNSFWGYLGLVSPLIRWYIYIYISRSTNHASTQCFLKFNPTITTTTITTMISTYVCLIPLGENNTDGFVDPKIAKHSLRKNISCLEALCCFLFPILCAK